MKCFPCQQETHGLCVIVRVSMAECLQFLLSLRSLAYWWIEEDADIIAASDTVPLGL